jgi:hypothetical protein
LTSSYFEIYGIMVGWSTAAHQKPRPGGKGRHGQ